MLPYLHSQGGVSHYVSPFAIDIYYTHYTYTQLPRFQHCSYDSQYKEWNKLLPIYSYYVTAKTKKDLLLKKVFAIYVWSRFTDSNRRPTVYKTVALTS